MNNLGVPVIGLGERSGDYADLPLQWMPPIQVADVGASVRRTLDLGSDVLLHPKDDDGNSLWRSQSRSGPIGCAKRVVALIDL
jgi:uncharacterized protein